MIPDAELQQMKADAERMQALREKATPGPWLSADGGKSHDYFYDVTCPHKWEYHNEPVQRTLLQLNWNFNENLGNDRYFIAATRTDPSAANVLRLVSEVERLREQLNEIHESWGMKIGDRENG